MNIYGKRILEALDRPRTLEEMEQITGFSRRFVFEGIWDARAEHIIVCRHVPGEASTFELWTGDTNDER